MQIRRPILCLGILLARCCAPAQGTFQNLDFEQAKIIINGAPALIATSNALPGWTVLANGAPLQEVQRDGVLADGVGIADAAGPGYDYVLHGNFSVILGGIGIIPFPVSIAQSGTVPAGSESLTFLALGGFSVSFAGHSLPLQVLGNLPYYGQIYGANISAYAGQYGQLMFQTGPFSSDGVNILDDIAFSAQGIPEPGALSILGLGALVLGLQRRGRRARPATTR
jgi:hypothetical protein